MGNEEVLYESEERQTVPDVINFLRQLADRMTDQQVVFGEGEEEVTLEIPHNVMLEIEVEREEEGPGKVKTSLEIEIEWIEDRATLGGEYSAAEEEDEDEGEDEDEDEDEAVPAAEEVDAAPKSGEATPAAEELDSAPKSDEAAPAAEEVDQTASDEAASAAEEVDEAKGPTIEKEGDDEEGSMAG